MKGIADTIGDFDSLAVLISGGLDSAILLGEMLRSGKHVQPLYVRNGLYWEPTELQYLHQYLDALRQPLLQPLKILDLPVIDLYDRHWSITGEDVPDGDSPDAAVFLPGRNVLLLSKAILWCHLHRIPAVALAPLETNPFPDATPEFFDAYRDVVNRAVEGSVQVLRPYLGLHKTDVMERGKELPLHWTFSCIRPHHGRHCASCNKCAERKKAFRDAGLVDPTQYHQETSCSV